MVLDAKEEVMTTRIHRRRKKLTVAGKTHTAGQLVEALLLLLKGPLLAEC